MRPVKKLKAPDNFVKVTAKADAFLIKFPKPTKKEIRSRPHWRLAIADLMEAYDETCAYSGLRLHRDAFTVDHYLPVSRIWGKNPELAYDWNNFRLASRHMNTEKRDFTDVLDPFEIPPQSFEIVFPSMLIKAGPALSPSDKAKVNATIKRLKLNTKEEYKDHRRKLILKYCKFAKKSSIGAALDYLDSHAPYIVDELKRQKLTKKILQMVIISPRANKNNILP